MKTPICILFASWSMVVAAQAAVIYTPIGATSSLGNLSNRPITDAIDGSGLSALGNSANILAETHVTASANDGPYFIGAINSVLTFDLGSVQPVDTIHIWNYTRTGEQDRGIKGFDISFSDDGITWGTAFSLPTVFDVVAFIENSQQVAVQSRSFTSQSGRYIQFTNVTNHGDTTYTGFGEIRFAAVPEPGPALAGLLLGLGLLRRRRN